MQAIPSFYLYGEAPRDVDARFVHVEELAERSRPANWSIRAHAHADLSHVFLLTEGGGEMRAESETRSFAAPCLLVVPSGVIHAFHWTPQSAGRVVTVAGHLLREIEAREPELAGVFAGCDALALDEAAAAEAGAAIAAMARELSWHAAGRNAAVEAQLVSLLVATLRASQRRAEPTVVQRGPRAVLVARFRDLIERRLRSGGGVSAYCAELGVTPSRLRLACLAVTGSAPLQLIQDRLALEAKRSLLYSNMTVSEIAYDLQFDDPAYFSRFFSKLTGTSPQRFRAAHQPEDQASDQRA